MAPHFIRETNMRNFLSHMAFTMGCLLTAVILIVYIRFDDSMQMGHDAEQMIAECQESLPRSEECVLVALPVDEVTLQKPKDESEEKEPTVNAED